MPYKNKEDKNANERERYKRLNADPEHNAKRLARKRAWWAKNKEKKKKYRKSQRLNRLASWRRGYSKNVEKYLRKGRKQNLARYGLTEDSFAAMLLAQEGKCKICTDSIVDKKGAHVDHDHLTGKVRSLLCINCNWGLGQFKDDPERLRIAASYLEFHHSLRKLRG